MSGKGKMRCARCHKTFKASSAKQTLCADCEAKERRARVASKAAPATGAAAPVARPKIVGPGANILVPGLVPPPPPTPPAAAPHDGRATRDTPAAPYRHEPTAEHGHGFAGTGTGHGPQPQQRPQGGVVSSPHPRPQQRGGQPRPSAPPRPKKEPAPVIILTDELRERIETRYRELAQPVEFDGIRTRIAADLAVPKALVKKAVLDLRQRDQTPSWWELQGYHGGDEELARIRAAYMPHLPVPLVGIHKQIAADLGLDAGAVYQAIRRIRAEMRLPQFNPPESHAAEPGVQSAGDASPVLDAATPAPVRAAEAPEASAG